MGGGVHSVAFSWQLGWKVGEVLLRRSGTSVLLHWPLSPVLPLSWLLRGSPRGPVRLRLCTSKAAGVGSIPGWGTKIPHAAWYSQKYVF